MPWRKWKMWLIYVLLCLIPMATIWSSSKPHTSCLLLLLTVGLMIARFHLGPSCCLEGLESFWSHDIQPQATTVQGQSCPFPKDPCRLHLRPWDLFLVKMALLEATTAFKNKACMDRTPSVLSIEGGAAPLWPPEGQVICYWRRKASCKTGYGLWVHLWLFFFSSITKKSKTLKTSDRPHSYSRGID